MFKIVKQNAEAIHKMVELCTTQQKMICLNQDAIQRITTELCRMQREIDSLVTVIESLEERTR